MFQRVISLCLIALLTAFHAQADEGKQFKRYIEELDIPVETRSLAAESPGDFWLSLKKRNLRLHELENNISKMGKSERKALSIIKGRAFHPQYTCWVNDSMQSFCDSMSRTLGFYGQTPEFSLHVAEMYSVKVFTVLKENGYAVCVTRGLLEAKGLSKEMLVGALVNGYVHGFYSHPLALAYNKVKREKRNNTLADLGNAIDAIAMGIGTATGRGSTDYANYYFLKDRDAERRQMKVDDLCRYARKYEFEQELEADLAAYRFMEQFGFGGENYINLLRLLEANQALSDEISDSADSPGYQYRISFLTYVKDHPEIVNTKNGEIIESIQRKKMDEIKSRQAPK